jgi:1,4-dihydroxy-2-naphthoate octaprenyltransferase
MKKILAYVLETRAGILSTTIIPVILGSVLASYRGSTLKPGIFWAVLLGFIFIHLGTNVINDYFDALDGTDNINKEFIGPFTGGSRLLQSSVLTLIEVRAEGIVFFVLAAACLAYASLKSNGFVLLSGMLGMASGIFYSAPPFKIARTGFGEALVFLNFGPLIAFASYTAQTNAPSLEPMIISLPLGLLTAAFVVMAEFPDYNADRETGKNNLVVRLGRKRSRILYAAITAAAFSSIPVGIFWGIMPAKGLLAGCAGLLSAAACLELWKKYETPSKLGPACALTLAAHFIAGALLIGAYVR